MEYYPTMKRNELSSYKKSWRTVTRTLLSERSQSEKAGYSMVSNLRKRRKKQNHVDKKSVIIKIQSRKRWLKRWGTGDF